ncbi:acylphosphatase [Amaricoccus sp.]|uniref:acylphosphatase n=1 Tax=Amaricoccus sp. TaxID=1872485 RepID=UPI00261481F1|nr:acylphosphatase [uncultured Amaricoccus sp.]
MDNLPASVAVHVIGRVQGVGFRAWMAAEARGLGLSGWAANDPDGSVRAVLTGREEAVTLMLDRLRVGPPAARVDRVLTEPADPDDSPSDFRVTL